MLRLKLVSNNTCINIVVDIAIYNSVIYMHLLVDFTTMLLLKLYVTNFFDQLNKHNTVLITNALLFI